MKYKMVAVDFDDTLLKSDYTISKRTLKTISDYIDKGGIFTIATGRMYKSIKAYLNDFNVTAPIICYQGALIVDSKTDTILKTEALNNKLTIKILIELERRGLYCQMYVNDNLYVMSATERTMLYEQQNKIKAIETKIPLSEYAQLNNVTPTKILSMAEQKELKQIANEVRQLFASDVVVNLTKPTFMEIASNKASKALALEYILKQNNLTKDDLIAIGDSMNDISMIMYAGLGVAVDNAFDEVKQIADEVTLSNDLDGVAIIIEKYCLQQ